MAQQLFVRRLEQAMPACAAHRCIALAHGAPIAPPETGGMLACVVMGSCVAQRLVAGHWIDQATFVHGGLLLATGAAPLRIVGQAAPQAAALLLTDETVTAHFHHVARVIPAAAVLGRPADAMATSLANVLLASESAATGVHFQQNIAELLLARLSQISRERLHAEQPRAGVLASWRLRRVTSWVSERIGEEMSLADMAAAAGLSRMHFAAQFKASVGVTPRQYVLLQRIEKAKTQLRNPKASILDIALSVGFQTQAHFATVFKRLEQTTPSQWRQMQMAA